MQAGIHIIQGLHIFFFNWGHFKILQLTVDAQMCFTVCVSGKMLPLYTNYKSKLSYFLCQTLSNDCWTACVITGKIKPSSQGPFQLQSMQTRNRAVHHSCSLLLQLHVGLKQEYLLQGQMDY